MLGAIGHPDVQIEQGAGVVALFVREPVLIASGGYGPEAAEAYRIAGSIVVMTMLEAGIGLEVKAGSEDVQICCGHVLACFQAPDRSRSVSLFYACHLIRLPLALRDGFCSAGCWDEFRGGFGLVALVQRVRRAGAGLEVDGLLQEAGDALHFELYGGGGDAPVVSAAVHDELFIACRNAEGDATWDALLYWFRAAAFVLLRGVSRGCCWFISGREIR